MIFDKTLMFSKEQTVNGPNVLSTNVIDLGAAPAGLKRDVGKGGAIPILVQVVEKFTGTGSVYVRCEVSDTENFASYDVIAQSTDVGVAELEAGYVFTPERVQRGAGRYMRLRYQAVAGMSGKITAGITMGNQSNG